MITYLRPTSHTIRNYVELALVVGFMVGLLALRVSAGFGEIARHGLR